MGDLLKERFKTANRVEVFLRGDGVRKLLGQGPLTGRLGEATDASINVNTGNRPLHTIGTPYPVDNVDGAHTYEVSLGLLFLQDRGSADLINAEAVDIDYIDRLSGKKIGTAEECRLVTGSFRIQANQPVMRDLRFNALRIV